MLSKPRYKIARRYGPELFEKTSTQKFALREGQRAGKRMRARSDFAAQLAEKQKARHLYGIGGRQMRSLARAALQKKNALEAFFTSLEMRADNAVYRARLAPTRRAARQLISHGHFMTEGRRLTIPSRALSVGDTLSVRAASVAKKVWPVEKENESAMPLPPWLSYDTEKRTMAILGTPTLKREEVPFRIDAVLEFYRR